MMTIEHVTREINRILAAIGAVEAKAAKKAAGEVLRVLSGSAPPASGEHRQEDGRAPRPPARPANRLPRL